MLNVLRLAYSTKGYIAQRLHDDRHAVAPAVQGHFNDPASAMLELLDAAQNIQGASGVLIRSRRTTSAIFGRRHAVLLGAVIMVISAAIQGAPQSGHAH